MYLNFGAKNQVLYGLEHIVIQMRHFWWIFKHCVIVVLLRLFFTQTLIVECHYKKRKCWYPKLVNYQVPSWLNLYFFWFSLLYPSKPVFLMKWRVRNLNLLEKNVTKVFFAGTYPMRCSTTAGQPCAFPYKDSQVRPFTLFESHPKCLTVCFSRQSSNT